MTPLEALRLLWGLTVTGMSKNDMTFSNLRSCSLPRSSTMSSPLRCLVTPWGSAPRILTSSLWILKGDFAATFRLSCELITINLTYGDQPNKGEDPIRGAQSSAFLLHAEGGAPALPRHDFLHLSGVGKGPFILIESIEFRFWFSSGAPHPPGSPTRGHRRGSPAQKVPGLPRSYTPNRSLAASIGIDPRPAHQTRRD